jgi:hypothetical protein
MADQLEDLDNTIPYRLALEHLRYWNAFALLLAYIAPNFIAFQPRAVQIAHLGIHHGSTTLSDLRAKPHNRVPVNARCALD